MDNRHATVSVPRPIVAGPEMAALERFYPDVTLVGHIVEGGTGPGTPAMSAHGCGIHESIQDGRWIVGTYAQEQYSAGGATTLVHQLHWVVGWDPARSEYRATMAESDGHADVLTGQLVDDRLSFTTAVDAPVRLRMVWDATDPDDLVWWRESKEIDGPWMLIARYHLYPTRFEDA